MKIYTKTGDSGTTSLFGGERVEKNSARIEAYGEVDELNSLIGVIVAEINNNNVILRRMPKNLDPSLTAQDDNWRKLLIRKLLRIQEELFVLGADLATPLELESRVKSKRVRVPRIVKRHIKRLEREIDKWSTSLTQLRNFILPGGGKVGSKLHLARTVARRAERAIVELTNQEKINSSILPYINRLSDWLFTLARYINKLEGQKEKVWRGRSKT